jgi:hypothetical protein
MLYCTVSGGAGTGSTALTRSGSALRYASCKYTVFARYCYRHAADQLSSLRFVYLQQ